jgi:hypothetical protein
MPQLGQLLWLQPGEITSKPLTENKQYHNFFAGVAIDFTPPPPPHLQANSQKSNSEIKKD